MISPEKPVTAYSPGDANGDGVIDSADVDYVERVILGLSPLTAGCDANQDGQVNMGDVSSIEYTLSNYYAYYYQNGNIALMRGTPILITAFPGLG